MDDYLPPSFQWFPYCLHVGTYFWNLDVCFMDGLGDRELSWIVSPWKDCFIDGLGGRGLQKIASSFEVRLRALGGLLDVSSGTTLRTWKAVIHLCGLKTSDILSGALLACPRVVKRLRT